MAYYYILLAGWPVYYKIVILTAIYYWLTGLLQNYNGDWLTGPLQNYNGDWLTGLLQNYNGNWLTSLLQNYNG